MERARLKTIVRRIAVANAAVMLLVLIQGALVTNTGSADGCGNSWPLCHGKFIPQYTVETAIEFSHRFVTTIATMLIFATAIGAFKLYRRRREMRVYLPVMIGFLFLQAGLGAAAVMWPQSDEVKALHFGISLIAFASTVLVAALMYDIDGWDTLRDHPVSQRLRWVAWGLTGYTYIVVYLGAYVRHTNSMLACSDWPLCNGSVFPGFSGPVGIAFGHRVSAAVLVIGMAALLYWTRGLRRTRPDLFWGSILAVAFVIAQAIGGGIVVLTQVDTLATMSHSILVSLFFGTMAYLSVHVLPRPEAARCPAAHAVDGRAPIPAPSTVSAPGD
ncbi:MAG TPA: heme A synthase [Thermomicrobiales bacterium]|nr:heme A synthase [Thermomicrobiales bacterium]